MTAVKKFLFETSFDEIRLVRQDAEPVAEEVEAEEVGEEDVAPTFSEAEVNAARDEGFARGKEEGIRDASGAIERQISDTLGTVDERLAHLIAGQEQSNTANAGNAVTVAVTVVRKIFPRLDRRHGLDEVERLIERSMETVINEPRVTITVNAALHDSLDRRLTAMTSEAGYEGQVVLRANSSIADGDCRIEWADGGAERDTAAMWREIDDIIERNRGAGEPTLDRTEPRPEGAVTPVDEAETSVDDAGSLVVDAESGATPGTSATPGGVVAQDPLAAENVEPESLMIQEADILTPPGERDAALREPDLPIPEDGAPPADAPEDIEIGSDAPPTDGDDMKEGAGETPADDEPAPDDATAEVADEEHAEEETKEGAAAQRTSDPTEGG